MLNMSRIGVYDYVYNLLYGVVTDNVYSMNEPQELTPSDADDGFLVIRVGELNDASEFTGNAYAWARVYIDAYIPPISRGRLDFEKYKAFEDAINNVIEQATNSHDSNYFVQDGSILSMDNNADNNADNAYFMFVKSFVVMIDGCNDEESDESN